MSEGNGYWHVLVTPNDEGRVSGEVLAVDKDEPWVQDRVLSRRRRGEPLVLGGRTLEWSEIERLRITVTSTPTSGIIPGLEAEDARSDVWVVGGSSYKWRVAATGDDITDDLIDGPPGIPSASGVASTQVDARNVMVVHGRDSAARRAMFDFLRALDLQPLEWGKIVEATGKGTPYVGEMLERAFGRAAAVVVLFTPDDEARLRQELQGENEAAFEMELTPQARPNVLFEAGMAFGIHPDRTVLVELGELRPFSDVFGRHVVRLDGSDGPLQDIARRLKTAGCEVDDSGDEWAVPRSLSAPLASEGVPLTRLPTGSPESCHQPGACTAPASSPRDARRSRPGRRR
jgi:predicted nucleotide-binding protein